MGESIPIGWSIVPLSDMVEKFQNGFAFSAKDYVDVGIPIVTMGSIQLDGIFKTKNTKLKYWNIKDRNKLSRYLVNPHDLIIAMTDVTPTMELIGRSCIVRGKQEYLLNQRVGLISLNSLVASKIYFAYYSNSEKWRSYCIGSSGLGAQANLGTEQILNGPVLLPPLPEQKKIATILTSVDTVIEKTQAQIDKLNDLKTGMMQELLTKGIGPDGKPHTEFKDSPVGRIPVGWEVQSITNAGVKIEDGDRGINYPKEKDFEPTGYCLFLSAKNVTKTGFDFSATQFISEQKESELKKGKVLRGDIIITTRGTVGNTAHYTELVTIENMRINSGMAILRNQEKQLVGSYLAMLLRAPVIKEQIDLLAFGTAQPQLTISIINNIVIPLPPVKEQQAIVSSVASIEQRKKSTQRNLSKYRALKKALMQDLLTGKVRVTPDPE